jgi:hypothetical protein
MAHLINFQSTIIIVGEGRPNQFPPWRWEELFDYYLYLGCQRQPCKNLRLPSVARVLSPPPAGVPSGGQDYRKAPLQ